MDGTVKKDASRQKRLTRQHWLAQAIETLANKGAKSLTVSGLAGALGVTKGSFYWHFKDRNEFLRQLIDYWLQAFTENVIEQIDASPGSPEERLLVLMEFLIEDCSARFDVAVRAWAARDPALDVLVRKADEQRLLYVRALFADMGFQGPELEMRTQTFVVYHSFDQALLSHLDQSQEERRELLKRRHAFFTRK